MVEPNGLNHCVCWPMSPWAMWVRRREGRAQRAGRLEWGICWLGMECTMEGSVEGQNRKVIPETELNRMDKRRYPRIPGHMYVGGLNGIHPGTEW